MAVTETRAHVHPLRVYYEDTDAAGVVYYANYLRYIERARTEMLRDAGFDHIKLRQEQGLEFFVKSLSADYVAPARLDDSLEVHTRVVNLNGASMEAAQTVRRGTEDLVKCTVKLVCLNAKGRPARLPADLRARMQAYLSNPRRDN